MARPRKNPAPDLVMPVHDGPISYPDGDIMDETIGEEPAISASPAPPEPEPYAATIVNQIYSRRNPSESIASALIAIGDLYNQAGEVSSALTGHLKTSAAEPELHSFLHRVQGLLGDFRAAITQIETSISDKLREAIETVQ